MKRAVKDEVGAKRREGAPPPRAGESRVPAPIARAIVGLSGLVVLGAFLGPLWHYNFTAPLYPEYPQGLPMTIYINHLGGRIDLVNELNHYIGMRTITESNFAVLWLMPWLVGLLSASALAVAASSRDRLWPLASWLGAFGVIGLALLGDFYWWLYEYGHDLNPHAAIRIAPFTPHLLGSYVVLGNFHVMSWPGPGAIAMIASFALGLLGFVVGWLGGGRRERRAAREAEAAFATHEVELVH